MTSQHLDGFCHKCSSWSECKCEAKAPDASKKVENLDMSKAPQGSAKQCGTCHFACECREAKFDRIRRLAIQACNNWYEFGPEGGMSEIIDHLDEELKRFETPHLSQPETKESGTCEHDWQLRVLTPYERRDVCAKCDEVRESDARKSPPSASEKKEGGNP